MKKVLLATLAAGLLVSAAPVHADDTDVHYSGGCSFATVNDTTPGGQLGGQNQWTGEADVLVVATDAAGTPTGETISADCVLRLNNDPTTDSVVLSASGPGVAANASPGFSFSAGDNDVVQMCTRVTLHNHTAEACGTAETTPLIPQPVIDAINLLIDTANGVFALVDPTICDNVLKPLAGSYGDVEIDDEGDISVFGELWWDCPIYGS